MTQLRHLISHDAEEAMWDYKDRIQLLNRDPASMYRQEFVAYLEAKADAVYRELTEGGMPHEQAIKEAQVRLSSDTEAWKAEAKRRKAKGKNG